MSRDDVAEAPPPSEYRERLQQRGFVLARRLGRGAFGTVFRAHQPSLGRDVAVKFFNSTGVPVVQDAQRRFEREALLLARVEHSSIPYIITTARLKDDAKTPYIVMQLVRGQPLDDRLKSEHVLPLRQACQITCDLLDALRTVHGQEILHRDIKPNNIITDQTRAWLVDFSLGAALRYEPGLTRATVPQRGLGVPEYAAPEQLDNASGCDARADIYSIGIVLFEMLSGHPRIDRPRLSEQLSKVPPGLIEIIQRACAPSLDARFESATAFREQLLPFARIDVSTEVAQLSICPNRKCRASRQSDTGYFFGPRLEVTSERYCDGCGTPFVRACPRCATPLSPNAHERVVKTAKSARDAGSLFCSSCGHSIFDYPTCKRCGSLLKLDSMDIDTSIDPCPNCRKRGRLPPPVPTAEASSDDDIPF